MKRSTSLLGLGLLLATSRAFAADDTVPGEVTAPYPTLHNASLEWAIDGDDDGDATVTVRYRVSGASDWRTGLSLYRVVAGSNQGFSWANRFAGSVFGLEEGTTYEIELTLADPDGGSATQTVNVTTRTTPEAASGAPTTPVTPGTIDGALAAAAPGDVLVLGDGTYGEIVVPVDGAEGQPVVLRPANPGMAVVEGDVRIDGRSHVIVEGLVVHGKFKFNDADSITVRGCTIETVEDGVVSFGTGVRNALVTDNTITGATQWYEGALGVDGDNVGEGVVLTGPGNVIAFNRVSGFRDCLSLLEDAEAVEQISVDFYGNDLSECADDAIEADFSMGNVRVYHNRIRDSFMGISSQPSLGGPAYFYRNVMYNVAFQAFKLQRSSVGDVLFHNTVIKSGDAFSVNTTDVWSRATSRNNLFIGGPGGTYNGYDSGPGYVMELPSADEASCSFDYDGFGSIGSNTFHGEVGATSFDSVAEMQQVTTEQSGLQVDLAVFDADVAYPADPFAAPATPSFALSASGVAIDKGVRLDNINDGFAATAPDLGALELGADPPVYGPGGNLGSEGTGGQGGGGTGQGGGAAGGGDQGGSGAASSGSGAASGSGGGDATDSGSDDGCGCEVPGRPAGASGGIALLAMALSLILRRRVRSY